jgi:hypothetical protein
MVSQKTRNFSVWFPSEYRTMNLPIMKHNANHSNAVLPAADVTAIYTTDVPTTQTYF